MHGIPQHTHSATHVLEGVESPRPQGQLSLPSGPTHILKGRPRTDPDDVWLDAMRVASPPTSRPHETECIGSNR